MLDVVVVINKYENIRVTLAIIRGVAPILCKSHPPHHRA
jgi:hypothetical protein